MDEPEFFEILGYLTSPKRNTKLDVETHPRKQDVFENKYRQLTGVNPVPDNHNYYVWDANADKWGTEMRIYFNGISSNIHHKLHDLIVSPRPGFGYDFRINNNDFIWRLIEYGFLLQDEQDETRVRQHVPAQYQADFNNGYNIA
jgi:hypothetical protein